MNDAKSAAKAIFLEALDCKGADEIRHFLEQACGTDAATRARVEELLRAHQDAGAFLGGAATPDATRDQPIAERPGTVIGPYKLLEQIGEGGFGLVFMAEQRQPVRRKVALKILKPGMDTRQVIARFEAERQALALMDHPNIAKVLDAGETASGRPHFVMELVKGVAITDHCDQNRLTTRQRLELFVHVCQAVQHAHQKGIIHRDIKPSNVMVMQVDVPVVKVIDFGIAKALGQQLTDKTLATGFAQMIGTPMYMSPEQAQLSGLDIDTRTDIYSLGVLLYELLTGTTPFDPQRMRAAGFDEVRRIIRDDEPPRPSTRLSTLGQAATTASAQRQSDPRRLRRLLYGELDWIVMKALDKDRNRRYETASAFAADVERYLRDEPVTACPPSAWYRVRKLARRHRAILTTAALVALALVLGTAASVWQALRATDALNSQRQTLIDLGEANAQVGKRLEQVTTAQQILKAIFRDLDPRLEEKGGPPLLVQLGQRLDKVADLLEGEAAGDRPAVAQLQVWLANAQLSLGYPKRAIALLLKARQCLEEECGPDDPETLGSMHSLAVAYQADRQLKQALPLYEQTLKKLQATLGADHPDTLVTMNCLASAYQDDGQLQQALPLCLETLAKRQATLGPDHAHTLASMNNLANAYQADGQFKKALPLYEQTLAKRQATLGPDHFETLASMNNLATAYKADGQFKKALPLHEQTLAKRQAKLGFDHPSTLASMNNLATAYWSAHQLHRSVPLFEETLRISKTKLGPDHPDTLQIMANLGVNYRDAGRLPEAMATLEATLDRARKLANGVPGALAGVPAALAATYDIAGQFAKAEPLHRNALEQVRKQFGIDDLRTAGAVAQLGVNLLLQKKYAEAEPLLRAGLQTRTQKQANVWTTFNTSSMLGASLLGQKKYADAEPLLLQGYQGMKQREVQIPNAAKSRLSNALDRLIDLYDAWGKSDEAAKWRAIRDGDTKL